MIRSFLLLLLAHLIADFVLQTNKMVIQKNSIDVKIRYKGLFKHSLIFFIFSFELLSFVGSIDYVRSIGILLLSVSHFMVDWLKVSLKDKFREVYLFVGDQILHIFLILFFVICFEPDIAFELAFLDKTLIILSGIIILTSFTNLFIHITLSSINLKIEDDIETVKIGRYIGCVERILTVFAIMAGAYEALAALYAAKAAVRFGQVRDDPQFGEYFILGTSLSAIIAISVGFILKKILVM